MVSIYRRNDRLENKCPKEQLELINLVMYGIQVQYAKINYILKYHEKLNMKYFKNTFYSAVKHET